MSERERRHSECEIFCHGDRECGLMYPLVRDSHGECERGHSECE